MQSVCLSVCLVSCDLADIQHNTRVQLLTDLTDDVEELEAQMNQRRWRLLTPYNVQYNVQHPF